MMKKTVLFLLLCMAAAPGLSQTLTLDECRAAAEEHNRTLKNSRLDLDAALQTRREAFTTYFPQVSASGGVFQAQHGLVQADFAIPQMGSLPLSLVKRGILGSVTAVQPLFAGLKIVSGNKLARLGEEVAQLQLQKTAAEVRERTDTYFWQVVSLRDNLSTIEAVERQLAEIHRQVALSVKAGLVTTNDLLRVELRQRRENGADYILLAPGNYGADYICDFIGLDPKTAVLTSNFIGDSLEFCKEFGFHGALLIGHIGKFVKLAGGMWNTHSKFGDCRMEIIASHSAALGLRAERTEEILHCATCDDALHILDEEGLKDAFLVRLGQRIGTMLGYKSGELRSGAILFSKEYGFLCETEGAEELLEQIREG